VADKNKQQLTGDQLMKHRTFTKALIVAMTVAAICSGCVLPPALHKEGAVCEMNETSTHGHTSTWKDWQISLHSRVQVDYAMPRIWKNALKVLDADPTDLQKIDMRVVNRSKDPIPHGLPDGCKQTQDANLKPNPSGSLDDFVFAFGIGQVDNGPSGPNEPAPPERRSPHMLVYLPLHTKAGTPLDTVQEFRILLLHLEPKDKVCAGDAGMKERCEALKSIRTLWETENHSARKLKDLVAANIKRFIAPKSPLAYHNGVIHGTF
jgi:hypothetical protein